MNLVPNSVRISFFFCCFQLFILDEISKNITQKNHCFILRQVQRLKLKNFSSEIKIVSCQIFSNKKKINKRWEGDAVNKRKVHGPCLKLADRKANLDVAKRTQRKRVCKFETDE